MAGSASSEEKEELATLVGVADTDTLSGILSNSWQDFNTPSTILDTEEAEKILQQILQKENKVANLHPYENKKGLSRRWYFTAVAAAILLLITGGYWFFKEKTPAPATAAVSHRDTAQDVQPGKNKAVLALADGRKIVLDSATMGLLASQGNAQVVYKDGKVSYEAPGATGNSGPLFNTLSTANGESFSLTLSDGTRLWLNAASSARFPVVFNGPERRVEITGEVYFEVAKNKAQPFIVSANGMEVQALGTAFNVNAYTDERSTKTTLVEGSVKVSHHHQQVMLQPGQQSTLQQDGKLAPGKAINVQEVVAWKEGVFYFDNATLETILRQFARWYDVRVRYEGTIKDRKFFGIIGRNSNLSSVLKLLKANDISFRIEGKELVVTSM